MLKTFVLIVLLLSGMFTAGASGAIIIDSDCIKLEDIFPGIGIKEDVYCGLNYGEEKTINRQMSMYIINKYKIEGARPGEVTFRRKGVLLTEEKFKNDITDLLSVMYSDLDVEINNIRMGRDFYYSEEVGYTIDLPKNRFGNVAVSVDNGKVTFGYTVNLVAYKDIYVSKGSIKRGQDIDKMVALERYDLSKIHGEAIDNPKGYIATRGISAGRPVTTSDVMKKPDALEGTNVMLVFKSGALNVSTAGELLEDAYIGKNVRAKNVTSGKIIRGTYAGDRKVLVNTQ